MPGIFHGRNYAGRLIEKRVVRSQLTLRHVCDRAETQRGLLSDEDIRNIRCRHAGKCAHIFRAQAQR